MPNDQQESKLLALIDFALQQDRELRDQYTIGDKFRFIRDRLQALLKHVQENVIVIENSTKKTKATLASDETLVYVYLYNAQGSLLKTWLKMLVPAVFYEYSVNRPIYLDKSHIEAFIRTKANKNQHAYLAVIVKKIDLIEKHLSEDAAGNPLGKVKEGSLHFEKMLAFTYNEHDYQLDSNSEIIRLKDNGSI